MLPEENNHKFDVTNVTFWLKEPNPWQIIFDGYKKGIKPGKQVRMENGVQTLLMYNIKNTFIAEKILTNAFYLIFWLSWLPFFFGDWK